MSSSQRQATKRYRERRRKRGLKRLEVQVPADEVQVIRRAAAILRDQADDAKRLRFLLGFSPELRHAKTALDAFSMPGPLSPDGEALWDDAMAQVQRDRTNPALGHLRDIDL